ncbi:unnamed protein product, partial [marine sediment metagenome]
MSASKKIYFFLYKAIIKYVPGKLGNKLRAVICRKLFRKCGRSVTIMKNAEFGTGEFIELGDKSGIGLNAFISVTSPLIIGDNVMMGSDVIIIDRDHNFSDPNIPMVEQGFQEPKPVKIGSDVWIGSRVIILPDTAIGNGVVIGAGSVITKDIPD